jgi:hypothetical protein
MGGGTPGDGDEGDTTKSIVAAGNAGHAHNNSNNKYPHPALGYTCQSIDSRATVGRLHNNTKGGRVVCSWNHLPGWVGYRLDAKCSKASIVLPCMR